MITYIVLISIDVLLFLVTLRQYVKRKSRNKGVKFAYYFFDYEYHTTSGMACLFLTAVLFIWICIHLAMEGIFFLFGLK